MTEAMRHWGPERMRRYIATLDAAIVPQHPAVVPMCSSCSALLDGFVYSGWLQGLMRWPYLCSGCAADWINLGGRAVLRWVR